MLKRNEMKLRIKPCLLVERDHKKSLRAYAHWGHKSNTICISKSIYELPLNHSIALIAHEVGHAIIGGGTEEVVINGRIDEPRTK